MSENYVISYLDELELSVIKLENRLYQANTNDERTQIEYEIRATQDKINGIYKQMNKAEEKNATAIPEE